MTDEPEKLHAVLQDLKAERAADTAAEIARLDAEDAEAVRIATEQALAEQGK